MEGFCCIAHRTADQANLNIEERFFKEGVLFDFEANMAKNCAEGADIFIFKRLRMNEKLGRRLMFQEMHQNALKR